MDTETFVHDASHAEAHNALLQLYFSITLQLILSSYLFPFEILQKWGYYPSRGAPLH